MDKQEEEKRKMDRQKKEEEGANWLSQALLGPCAELPDQK